MSRFHYRRVMEGISRGWFRSLKQTVIKRINSFFHHLRMMYFLSFSPDVPFAGSGPRKSRIIINHYQRVGLHGKISIPDDARTQRKRRNLSLIIQHKKGFFLPPSPPTRGKIDENLMNLKSSRSRLGEDFKCSKN